MTGKEKKYQLVRRYDLMNQVLTNNIKELKERLVRNMKVEAECSELSIAIRSWLESEENQLLSAQMKELDAEIIRFNNGIVTSEEFVKFLSTAGRNFTLDIVGEKCRLEHRLELGNLLKTMHNQGETMPDVIDVSKLAKYLVDC